MQKAREDDSCYKSVKNALTIKDNRLAVEFLAEFLGTTVLMAFGCASVAQYLLSEGASGTYLTVNLSWGLGVAMGVWICGKASGGHINPAVTLAFCIMGRLPWHKFLVYWIAQYLGAIAGSAIVFGVYYEALVNYEDVPGVRNPIAINGTNMLYPRSTAGIWATYPMDYLSSQAGFGENIVGTALLVMLVLSITDEHNMKTASGMVPFCIGLVVIVIGMTFGHNCGYAINPARDLGPRIFTCMAGWGAEPFSFRDFNWFWAPWLGPHVGAIIGGWIYLLFVGNHLPYLDGEIIEKSSRTNSEPRADYELNRYSDLKGLENSGYRPDSELGAHYRPGDDRELRL